MYYHIDLATAAANRWDSRRSHKRLDFTHLLHASNDAADKDNTLADVAASAVAHVHQTGHLNGKFVDELLEHCHFRIQGLGYETDTIDGVSKLVDQGSRNVVVILGCQTLKLLHARVDAAFTMIRQIGAPFDVVLSGGNPSAGSRPAPIVNEAREMRVYVDSLLTKDSSVKARVNLAFWTEPTSTDTEGNIQQFLASGILSESKPAARVFIVSSTFHLMRVAKGLHNHAKALAGYGVKHMILVGPENPFVDDAVKTLEPYVRSLAFEVYLDVIRSRRSTAPSSVELPNLQMEQTRNGS